MTLSPEERRLLRFQLALGAAGAGAWYAGVAVASDFASGIGVGLLISALLLRLLKKRS